MSARGAVAEAPAWRVGRAHVAVTLSGRQGRLRRPVPASTQRPPHRQTELARQIVGLIESALPDADGMERHGHHRVRTREYIAAGFTHEPAERLGEQPAAFVFEGVNDAPQRAVVDPGTARHRKPRLATPAPHAERTGRTIRRKCVTASHATRRNEPRDREPAGVADRADERPCQRRSARRAKRREKYPNERVGRVGEHHGVPHALSASARPPRSRDFLRKSEGAWQILRNDL
jgi:hypothetical protein